MKLSVVIPCYNEEATLAACVERVLAIRDPELELEIVIVDDCSTDRSREVARELARSHPEIKLCRHQVNQGKGAALRTGFREATGDVVAVQDADLEYDPRDLKRLIRPLREGKADVVLGSRFLSAGAHRVFYFWHAMGNRFLTLLSNMYTDLNLTDMETCYKVFRREVIQDITIHENRFGFEPEIVAEMAHRRLRIYEMGISYDGRSYAEGKKIGVRDGFRAIYCILRYNAYRAPWPLQFLLYLLIGTAAGLIAQAVLLFFLAQGSGLGPALAPALLLAGGLEYWLNVSLLFRSGVRWSRGRELLVFAAIVLVMGLIDLILTRAIMGLGLAPGPAHGWSLTLLLVPRFFLNKKLVFPEPESGSWR